MRTFLILLVFCSTLGLSSQWIYEGRLHEDAIFSNISVVDSGTVWAVGETWSGDSILIFRRSPGGLWKLMPVNGIVHDHSLSCIAAIDSLTAFVGTGYGSTNFSYLYKTTNGGQNWFQQVTLQGEWGYFNDIRFSKKDPAFGFAWSDPPKGNGTPMKILRTTNYGGSWTEYSVSLDTFYVGYTGSICVTDSSHAWFGLFSNITPSDPRGKILYTTNGGNNFLLNTLPVNGSNVNTIEFKQDNNFGLATIDYYYNYYFKSTNAGNSWTPLFTSFGFGSAKRIINIPNTNNWYLSIHDLGPANRVFKSTNDGSTWIPMDMPNQQFSIMHMDAVNLNQYVTAYAIGLGGEITKLKDSVSVIGITQIGTDIPAMFRLYQNYPNPFNPSTVISIDMPESGYASLKVFNSLGQEVASLIDGEIKAGSYQKVFNASGLPSGIYFYKFVTGGFSEVRKMSLIK